MNVCHVSKLCVVTALVGFGATFGLDRVIAAQPGQTDAEEGVQVLTRGPVHEAFAETVTFYPEPDIPKPKKKGCPHTLAARGESHQGQCGTGILPVKTQAGSLCHHFHHGLLAVQAGAEGEERRA